MENSVRTPGGKLSPTGTGKFTITAASVSEYRVGKHYLGREHSTILEASSPRDRKYNIMEAARDHGDKSNNSNASAMCRI